MATVQPSSRIAMRAYACIAGIGFSSPLTLMSVCAQLAAPPELLALASVNLLVSRALGGVVAVAVYNAVGKTRTAALVGPRLAAAVAPFGFPEARLPALVAAAQVAGGAALKKLPGMTPEIMEAIEMAMRHVYADSCTSFLCLAVSSSGTPELTIPFLQTAGSGPSPPPSPSLPSQASSVSSPSHQ
jgi:hypothetical protein